MGNTLYKFFPISEVDLTKLDDFTRYGIILINKEFHTTTGMFLKIPKKQGIGDSITHIQLPVEAPEPINIKELRDKFFTDCTDKRFGFAAGKVIEQALPKVNMTPHNVFEWFVTNLNIK